MDRRSHWRVSTVSRRCPLPTVDEPECRPARRAVAAEADLTLTMTRAHRREVLAGMPRALARTFTLRGAADLLRLLPRDLYLTGPTADARALVAALADTRSRRQAGGEDDDVPDPIGRPLEPHDEAGELIVGALVPLLTRLADLISADDTSTPVTAEHWLGPGCQVMHTSVALPYDDRMSDKRRLSASVDADLLAAAHQAVAGGRSESVSSWVNDALRLKAAHERRLGALDLFLADYEAQHGEISDEEMDAAARRVRGRAVVVRSAPRSA